MLLRFYFLFLTSLLLFTDATTSAFSDTATTVTILVSGETHAMLDACDCPSGPGGGFAERSSLIAEYRSRGPVVCLDAGGFVGGGVYDTYSGGRARDSLRSLAALRALGTMRYDAVAVGDDELQYPASWLAANARDEGIVLLSSNCLQADGSPAFTPTVLVRRGGITFGITAVTTGESLFPRDTAVHVTEPVSALRRIWPELCRHSDVQIILSHLGEAATLSLRDSFPACELLVNAHRKTSGKPIIQREKPVVVNFGYQGKTLSYASLQRSGDSLEVIDAGAVAVERGMQSDADVAQRIDSTLSTSTEEKRRYELYLMAHCPYGLKALEGFTQFVSRFDSIDWHIWFIGSVQSDGTLESLHGSAEVAEEQVWLGIHALYPDRRHEFLSRRAVSSQPTGPLLASLAIDTVRIRKWVLEHGRSELTMHYTRSTRQRIDASPTLLVNNQPFRKPVHFEQLARDECRYRETQEALCDSLPECLSDEDCRRPGKVGRCGEMGDCLYRDAVRFTFLVVRACSTAHAPEQEVIETTQELFPGAVIDTVTAQSRRGKRLIEQFSPSALPLYLFEKGVHKAARFSDVVSGLIEQDGYFLFKDGIVPRNFFFNRPARPDDTLLLFDPVYFPEMSDVLLPLFLSSHIRIRPLLFTSPVVTPDDPLERYRREEAARWLVLAGHGKNLLSCFATSMSHASNPWFQAIDSCGFSLDQFSREFTDSDSLLQAHWEAIRDLDVHSPCALLFSNRDLCPFSNRGHLEAFLRQHGIGSALTPVAGEVDATAPP